MVVKPVFETCPRSLIPDVSTVLHAPPDGSLLQAVEYLIPDDPVDDALIFILGEGNRFRLENIKLLQNGGSWTMAVRHSNSERNFEI